MTPQIVGRYHIVAEIGTGGSSNVYLAVARGPANFSRLLVLKRLHDRLSFEPAFVVMLLDEARIAARLSHPNIVQMVEVIEVAGEFFIVMEHLEGQTLRSLLHRSPLPPRIALTVICDVLEGMQYAHDLKDYDGSPLAIVHRDLKPSNVFVTYDGVTKIVDFGLARSAGRSTQTAQGVLKGSPGYMAPEQARQLALDRRTDLFAIGVMVWEIATGQRMWGKLKRVDILTRLLKRELPPSPRSIRRDVSPALDAVVARATAVEPHERYVSASHFQQALDDYLRTIGGRASLREVAEYVGLAFADERRKLQSAIDERLARVRRDLSSLGAGAPPLLSVHPLHASTTSSGDSSVPVDADGEADAATRVGGPLQRAPEHTKVMPGAPGRVRSSATGSGTFSSPRVSVPTSALPARLFSAVKQRSWTVVAVITATTAVAAVAFVASRWTTKVDGRTVGAEATSSSIAQTDGAAAKRIELRLRALPEDSLFYIDDGGGLPNPYEGSLPQGDEVHVLRVVAPDHREMTHRFVAKEDISLRFNLADERRPDAGKVR